MGFEIAKNTAPHHIITDYAVKIQEQGKDVAVKEAVGQFNDLPIHQKTELLFRGMLVTAEENSNLTKEVKELKKENDELKTENETIKKKIDVMNTEMTTQIQTINDQFIIIENHHKQFFIKQYDEWISCRNYDHGIPTGVIKGHLYKNYSHYTEKQHEFNLELEIKNAEDWNYYFHIDDGYENMFMHVPDFTFLTSSGEAEWKKGVYQFNSIGRGSYSH